MSSLRSSFFGTWSRQSLGANRKRLFWTGISYEIFIFDNRSLKMVSCVFVRSKNNFEMMLEKLQVGENKKYEKTYLFTRTACMKK